MKRLTIPPIFEDLLLPERFRYYAYYGGRGGAKSHSIARALLILGSQRKMRIVCARETQKSIAQSVHALLSDLIQEYNLPYKIGRTQITGRNGTEITFIGLGTHSADAVRSLEGADIVWVEEAHSVSARSWRVLRPTVRKDGSEIWLSWNPEKRTDPIHAFFVENEPPKNALIRFVGWRDNPFFTDELNDERLHDEQRDYGEYLHVWEGQIALRTEATVFTDVAAEDLDHRLTDRSTPHYGADFGRIDPTVLIQCYRLVPDADDVEMARTLDLPVPRRTLYVRREAYRAGLGIEQVPALFESVPGARYARIRADSAGAMEIAFLRSKGWDVIPSRKGPGSVNSGINFLRSAPIRIHPDCTNALREFTSYSFQVDPKTDEILDKPEDGNDHCIDATRYALENERHEEQKRPVSTYGPLVVPIAVGGRQHG